MSKLIQIMFFLFFGLNVFSQTDTVMTKIIPKSIDSVYMKNTNKIDSSIFLTLQGTLSDPVICNELGIKIIGGTEIPQFGLSIDYNPLFLKRFIGQIGFRSDFDNNQIFNASIESKFLINKYPKHIDFKISYDRFLIEKTRLDNFDKFTTGPIYRLPWISMGCFIGRDSYEKQLGFDLYFKYQCHRKINGSENKYISRFILQSLIGLWDNEITYDLNIDYLINFKYSCGVGYKKCYDFEEIFFTFRYLLCH